MVLYYKYKKIQRKWDDPAPRPIKFTRKLKTWLDAARPFVEDIYTECWEDYQSVAEHLLSFSTMVKFQQATNLRSLILNISVVDSLNPKDLCVLVKMLYEHFPLLEDLVIHELRTLPSYYLIFGIRDYFVLGRTGPLRKGELTQTEWILPFADEETKSYLFCGGKNQIAVGFKCYLDPRNGEKRYFRFELGCDRDNWW